MADQVWESRTDRLEDYDAAQEPWIPPNGRHLGLFPSR